MYNVYKVFFLVILCIGPCAGVVMSPKLALKELMDGNDRFINEKLLHPRREIELSKSIKDEQNPIAVILSCSDSRVSPEIIFDQGIGDLFIIRVAGNVLGSLGLESVKFAVLALKTPLIIVLGHENCGAVKAVVEDHTKIIPEIAKQIEAHCKSNNLTRCIKQNVLGVVADLEKDHELRPLIKKSQIEIRGGYYELGTGRVSFLK